MKLHYKSLLNNNSVEHQVTLESLEDFENFVETFPQLRESLYKYHDLRMIAKDMVHYLSSHHVKAWLTDS